MPVFIFNQMVEYYPSHTDAVFRALADPTRRDILRTLALRERTVNELAQPYQMSLAAVSKHIKVLEAARLVRRQVQGRTHTCYLNPEPLEAVREWMRFYERFWVRRLDALADALAAGSEAEAGTGTHSSSSGTGPDHEIHPPSKNDS